MFSDIFNLWNVIKCYQMSHFGDIVKTNATLNVPLFKGYQMLLNVTKCCKMLPNVGTISPDIEAGITLYTDHKPALFENSLSNKGQLSAWKLAEVADLLSIVENLYRQGGKMLFADPLSRVCGPTEGWYDLLHYRES